MKVCPSCNKEKKSLATVNECPACYSRRKRAENPEHFRSYGKARRDSRTPEQIARDKERALRNREKNREKAKALSREWYRLNKDRVKESNRIRGREWYLKNKERCKRKNTQHYEANKRTYTAKCAKRRAQKLRATPKWANMAAIRKIYLDCPSGMEVDHIVPLQGKDVCGLHVDYNLQYLSKYENRSKGNK